MEPLGRLHHTDKITHHGYHRFYPTFLETRRNLIQGMLEIGIDAMHSLNMWLEYLPNAFIYGIDINLYLKQPRYVIFKADQSKTIDLQTVATLISHPIDLIVDDGSHVPEHQLLTFQTYFQTLLQPGGIYVIEDVETSYWKHASLYGYPINYGYKHPNSIVEISKHMIDDINQEFLPPSAKHIQNTLLPTLNPETRTWISSITFAQNCIVFTKKTKEEYTQYANRLYRFSPYIHDEDDVRIFYHICCMGNWKDIVDSQLTQIISSGLYHTLKHIHVFVVSKNTDQSEITTFLSRYGSKIRVEKITTDGLENICMESIHDLLTDNTKFLYLHTKGVTRYGTTQYIDEGGNSFHIPELYKNIVDWRLLMEYFLIAKFKVCIDLLNKYDIVGVNFYKPMPHFSGNFWWSTGKHYNSLPRNVPHGESYNTKFNAKVVSLHQSPLIGSQHYFQPYPPGKYIDTVSTTEFIIQNGKIN